MSDPRQRVQIGERRKTFPVELFNQMIDSVERTRAEYETLGQDDGPLDLNTGTDVIVKNTTAGDLPIYSVLAVTSPMISPADDMNAVIDRPNIQGAAPAGGETVFAILQEPVPKSGEGRARIAGISWVKVNKAGATDGYAVTAAAVTANLASSAVGGAATILWSESGTGVKWALVRLPSSPCELTITERICDVSGTWTKTANLLWMEVVVIGGGAGGGSGVSGHTGAAGGGGAGGYSYRRIDPTTLNVKGRTLGATEQVTIGANGVGVLNAAGTAGSPSAFGDNSIAGIGPWATGAGGGGARAADNSGYETITAYLFGISPPGVPGGGAYGDVNLFGSPAGPGLTMASYTIGGNGGSTPLGGGGNGAMPDVNPFFPTTAYSGSGYGAGGGGGVGGKGGDGSQGIVIIREYTCGPNTGSYAPPLVPPITVTGRGSGSAGPSNNSVTLTGITIAAGSELVVIGTFARTGFGIGPTLTCTYNGVSMAGAGLDQVSGNLSLGIEAFTLKVTSNTTGNIVLTFSGSGTVTVQAYEITNLANYTVDVNVSSNGNSGAPDTGSGTTAVVKEAVFGAFVMQDPGGAFTWSNLFTPGGQDITYTMTDSGMVSRTVTVSDGFLLPTSLQSVDAALAGITPTAWAGVMLSVS